jgi:LysR family hca operon transcriptional activator
MKGELDLAFMRAERNMPELTYQTIAKEPLVVVMPSDHRLAALDQIDPWDLAGERFIAVSNTAPIVKAIVDDFLRRSGLDIEPSHEIDNLVMAMSIVASTRGVSLLPAYAKNFLPGSVVSRPLAGETPTVDLVIGYSKTNTSPILALFLSRFDDLVSRCRTRRSEPRAEPVAV